MRTTCSATYWEHGELAIYHSLSRTGSSERAHCATLGINVGRSLGNPFTFRTPPGHFAGTFSRENDERDRKLRKDNGSCPNYHPFAPLRRRWRVNVTTALRSQVKKYFVQSHASHRFVNIRLSKKE